MFLPHFIILYHVCKTNTSVFIKKTLSFFIIVYAHLIIMWAKLQHNFITTFITIIYCILILYKLQKCPILIDFLDTDYFDCQTHETGAPLRVQKCPNIRSPPTLFDIPKTSIALPPRCYDAICPILSTHMVLIHHAIHHLYHQSILLLNKKMLIGNQK